MAELKELRKFMGLTQRELAEKTGINIRQIQKIEKGEIDVSNMTAKMRRLYLAHSDAALRICWH